MIGQYFNFVRVLGGQGQSGRLVQTVFVSRGQRQTKVFPSAQCWEVFRLPLSSSD